MKGEAREVCVIGDIFIVGENKQKGERNEKNNSINDRGSGHGHIFNRMQHVEGYGNRYEGNRGEYRGLIVGGF